jgi:hypothetical protein
MQFVRGLPSIHDSYRVVVDVDDPRSVHMDTTWMDSGQAASLRCFLLNSNPTIHTDPSIHFMWNKRNGQNGGLGMAQLDNRSMFCTNLNNQAPYGLHIHKAHPVTMGVID